MIRILIIIFYKIRNWRRITVSEENRAKRGMVVNKRINEVIIGCL